MCDAAGAKRLLYLCNLIVWLGGAALLAIGLWMRLDPTFVHYLNVVNIHQETPLLEHAALVFIIVGCVAFVAGIIGCCGAIKNSQSLLFFYAFVLLLIMLAELAGGAMALYYRAKVTGDLEASMLKQVNMEYKPDNEEMVKAWDHIQGDLTCCGATNYTDWVGSYWYNNTKNTTQEVPDSCCSSNVAQCQIDAKDPGQAANSQYLHTKGCYTAMQDWFSSHTLVMTILGLAIGAAQIFGFISACCLRSALKGPNKYEQN